MLMRAIQYFVAERPAFDPREAAVPETRLGVTLCLQLNSVPFHEMLKLLNGRERERADRFHFPDDAERFIKCRGMLRRILAHLTGLAPQNLRFQEGDRVKPHLLNAPFPLHFNVSHSGQYGLIAVAPLPVGVDIQELKAEMDYAAVVAAYFHAHEFRSLQKLPVSDQRSAFFQFWTHKEAYLKGLGTGLSMPMDSFATHLHGGRVDGENDASKWTTTVIEPPKGYKASLATSFAPFRQVTAFAASSSFLTGEI